MDFSVKDFNVRLRTIRLREAILAMIVCFILNSLFCDFFKINDPDLAYITFFLFIMLFFVIVSIGTRGFKKDFDSLFSGINIFKIVMLAVLNSYFAICLSSLALGFSINVPYLFNVVSLPVMDIALVNQSPITFILELITAIIVAPIGEELLFRAVLFNRLKIKKGVITGMVLSSLLFGIGHFYGPNPYMHVFTAFVFGLLMCVFYLKYDNILMNISVHLCGNLFLYLLDLTPLGDILSLGPIASITGLLAMFSLLFIPVYIIYYAIKLK